MRLHRLVAILLLIESRGQIKARELADALETSVRTIHRDIDVLCESGIPITSTTGPSGGVKFMDGYKANISNLHCDDVVSLFLSGIGIHPDGQSEASINLKNALLKLERNLPQQYQSDIRTAREKFYFDPSPWWKEKTQLPFLDTLRKTLWQNRKVKIKYQKANDAHSTRIIHTYGLVVKALEWYLVGYCESKMDVRVFKCERITDAKILEETFNMPDDFSLEDFWNQSSKRFEKERTISEHYPVDIRLNKNDSYILKYFNVMKRSTESDYINASVNLYSYDKAKAEVLGLIGCAEIIKPAELREFAEHKLESMLKVYR